MAIILHFEERCLQILDESDLIPFTIPPLFIIQSQKTLGYLNFNQESGLLLMVSRQFIAGT